MGSKRRKAKREARRDRNNIVNNVRDELFNKVKQLIEFDFGPIEPHFSRAFINQSMANDLAFISFDFLKNNLELIDKYKPFTFTTIELWTEPEIKLYTIVLYTMFLAAADGNIECKELLKKIYKTYHKQEYNALKRFNSINNEELEAIVDSTNGVYEDVVTRVLGMCIVMEIKIDNTCMESVDNATDILAEIEHTFDDLYDESIDLEYLEEIFEESQITHYDNLKEAFKTDAKVNQHFKDEAEFLNSFIEATLTYLGYYPNIIPSLDVSDADMLNALVNIERIAENGGFDIDTSSINYVEMQRMGHLYALLKQYASRVNGFASQSLALVGAIKPDETVRYSPSPLEKKREEQTIKPVTAKVTTKVEDNVYLAEIERLKTEVKDKTREYNNLTETYKQLKAENRNLDAELVILQKKCAELTEENARLTSTDSNDNDVAADSVSIEEMTEYIKDMKIMIIGGNENWTKKIKQIFPEWTYISSFATSTDTPLATINADMVFFYTQTLGHSVYRKYINTLREHNIDFDYLYGTNLDRNIRQIYASVKAD